MGFIAGIVIGLAFGLLAGLIVGAINSALIKKEMAHLRDQIDALKGEES